LNNKFLNLLANVVRLNDVTPMDVNNSHIHDTVGNQHILQNQQTTNMSMTSVPATKVVNIALQCSIAHHICAMEHWKAILTLVNIAFQCSVTHHIALCEIPAKFLNLLANVVRLNDVTPMDVNNSHIHDTVGNQHIFQNQQTMNMSMMSVPSHQSFVILHMTNNIQCSNFQY
jgi:hypothetical protein